jgi:phage terminase large subunit
LIEVHKKYKEILAKDSRYYIVSGGRGSGKSFSVNALLVLLTYEAGHTILFTRYTLSSAYISIIPEFIEKLEMLGLLGDFHITKDEIKNKRSGSKIIFRGIKTSSGDQTANLKSLTGITTWVVDEAEELTDEQKFDTIDLSVRQQGKQNRVILILNPTTKEHFIYGRFFEDRGVNEGVNKTVDNTTYIHTTYLDNKDNLSQSYLDQIEQMKLRRPEKYKQQILGAWLNKAEGVIFDNWTIGEFKHIGTSVWGQDYGFAADPSTLVEVNIDSTNKRIYLKECFYLQRLTTSQISELNIKHARGGLIIGDSAEPRLLSEIKAKGCNVRPSIKGQGSITYGISLLQDYDIIVSPDSTNLIKELNNYRWLEKKSNTPIDNWNHLIDAVRYAVGFQLQNPNRGKYTVS